MPVNDQTPDAKSVTHKATGTDAEPTGLVKGMLGSVLSGKE